MKLAWYRKKGLTIIWKALGHLSCHEVPISDHELKVTPWEHKSSYNLHSATNLLETDEQLERINPNTHSSVLVLAYFFTFQQSCILVGILITPLHTDRINNQRKCLKTMIWTKLSIWKRKELTILFLNSFRHIYPQQKVTQELWKILII